MGLKGSASSLVAVIVTVLIFSGMQFNKSAFETSPILGGLLGSILFTFSLTAFGNIMSLLYGKTYEMKLFPEVCICLIFSVISSGALHKVSATSCLLFSTIALYFINEVSVKKYSIPEVQYPIKHGKRKEH